MAGKFEISKNANGTFAFAFKDEDKIYAESPVFEKEDECKRGVKAVKKNSRMKVQNTLQNDEEKLIPNFLLNRMGIRLNIHSFSRQARLPAQAVRILRKRLFRI